MANESHADHAHHEALLGIDTGGTFTDFVLVRHGRVRTHKVASTPDDPGRAILLGIEELGLANELAAGRLRMIHGSTVATNALLEGRLARTLYVGNRGFEDVLVLGRQARRALYALQPEPEPDLVADELRVGTGGRIGVDGTELDALTEHDLDELAARADALGVEAVAVNLLYAFRDARAERRIAARLGARYFVSCSADVLPEYREYERGVATYLNAALGPRVAGYLRQLDARTRGNRLAIMMSSGGTIEAEQAALRAVTLLLSGPAGGVVAAARLGAARGLPRLITFDMGGTSTDVALIDGEPRLSGEGQIAGLPLAIPMLDIHTIGAGGGSIASIDAGGVLQVGPRSAGALPGPACYGRGGNLPTVTDANVVLGRLPAHAFLGGRLHLDVAAARRAMAVLAAEAGLDIEQAAHGIVTIANESMAAALRLISVERGHDAREFALCCFGGAGGMHVCALADALGMRRVLLPPAGSVFSALGMLQAAPSRTATRAVLAPLAGAAAALPEGVAALRAEAVRQLAAEGIDETALRTLASVDLRYRGQSFALNLPLDARELASPDATALIARFHAAHAARYGHRVDTLVELVNLRVQVSGPPPLAVAPGRTAEVEAGAEAELQGIGVPDALQPLAAPLHARATLAHAIEGPAIITEPFTCTWLAEGWRAEPEADGTLVLARSAAG